MRTSVVALVSRFGLESLMPECDATRRWFLEATAQHPVTCVWAQIERASALEIRDLLATGDGQIALRHIAQTAESFGPVSR